MNCIENDELVDESDKEDEYKNSLNNNCAVSRGNIYVQC